MEKKPLAIALEIQRRAHGKKMAQGGPVEAPESHEEPEIMEDDELLDTPEEMPEEDHGKKILNKIMQRIHSGQ